MSRVLKQLSATELKKNRKRYPIPKKYALSIPQKIKGTPDLVDTELHQWAKKIIPPKIVQPPLFQIKAVKFTKSDLERIKDIHNSKQPTVEIIYHKYKPEEFLSTLWSTLVSYNYYNMKEEYKALLQKASLIQKKKIQNDWDTYLKSTISSFSKAGLQDLVEKDLDDLSETLIMDKTCYESVKNIASSGVTTSIGDITKTTAVYGTFEPISVAGLIPFEIEEPESTTNLCTNPVTHSVSVNIQHSFSLTVRLYLPCPTWRNWFRWCWKSFTVAGASVSFNFACGYTLDCNGIVVWGSGAAEACVTLLGITICASCSAYVTGTSGGIIVDIGNNQCEYAYAVTIESHCYLAGLCVFGAANCLQLRITAPCS